MKFQAVGLFVVSVLLTFIIYACATNGAKAPSRDLVIAEAGGDPNSGCKWKFNRDPSQKHKVSGPIVLESNPGGVCKVDAPSTEFYIGTTSTSGMKVLDMEAKDFDLQGSCKRCYPNTAGGMSCVTYPC